MRHLEDSLQKSIIKYWDLKYPKWKKRLACVPNGGKRNAIEAAKFKQMGVLSILWNRIKGKDWQAVREPERVSERV